MNLANKTINARTNSSSYLCHSCPKFAYQEVDSSGKSLQIINLEKLNRTKKSTKCDSQISFINFFKRASSKVSPSKSCPKEIFKHFYNFTVVSSVGDIPAYNLITPVIDSFNGKIGKFYPNFYKVSGFLA